MRYGRGEQSVMVDFSGLGTSHIKGAALFPAKPTVNYGFNMGSEMLVLNSENEKKQNTK